MEVYSKSSTPKLDRPSGKNYYDGATSYKAADINDVEESVQTTLSNLKGEVDNAVTNFDKLIEELDVNFGVKFIKLNDQKLGFVDVEAFNTLTKNLKTSMDKSSSDTTSFFGTCKGTITDINSWLTELQNNANEYKQQEVETYTKLPNEPISYGDWIKE